MTSRLLDGMVLDGRNIVTPVDDRARTTHRTLSDNTNPVDHLVSKNLMRRHPTRLERALFAARLVTARHGGDRRSEQYQGDAIKTGNPGLEMVTPADAARRIGLSKDAVETAGYILEHGADEFIAAIDAGIPWLTLNYADKIAHSTRKISAFGCSTTSTTSSPSSAPPDRQGRRFRSPTTSLRRSMISRPSSWSKS